MKQLIKSATAVAVGAVLSLTAVDAFAHKEGDFIVRVGAARVNPNDDSSNVLGANDGVKVDSATGLGFSGTWMLSDNWGLDVLAALPFKHDIDGSGDLAGLPIGETKQLPPTVSLQYYPEFGTAGFIPYFGLGVNYTMFFDEKVSTELKTALATNDVQLELDDSFGLATQVGADWRLTDNIYLNTSIWYVDIDTDADVKVDGVTVSTVNVEIDPWVAMVGFAWRF